MPRPNGRKPWVFNVHSLGSNNAGEAQQIGRKLAKLCLSVRKSDTPVAPPACLLSGGEPVVHVVPTDKPRKGGRNQELVLAAFTEFAAAGLERIVLLSGGTDGEDGPTDAAGALIDESVAAKIKQQAIDPADYLAINNSYTFFDQCGGLVKTGPTHTNVMDLRVALIE